MIEAAKFVLAAGMQPAHCVAVHALFSEDTAAELRGIVQSLVVSDSIPNDCVQLKLAPLIAESLAIAFA